MLTIAIIFTLLVALWGHRSASAIARAERGDDRRAGVDAHRTPSARLPASDRRPAAGGVLAEQLDGDPRVGASNMR